MTKKTPLYDWHLEHGACMVNFFDTMLPLRFSSEQQEHLAVRNNVGLFDVSHMGEMFVSGADSKNYLQYILSNNINKLHHHQAQYSLLLNKSGGIIDDLIIYHLAKDKYLCCINASNIEKDYLHMLDISHQFDVQIKNVSKQYAQIALQGPKAKKILSELTDTHDLKKFFSKEVNINNIDTLIARTGYTGEDGFEIFVANDQATRLWQTLYDIGQGYGLKPCGLAARDSLRIEAGMLLHGQDMNDTTTPLECGLMFAVDLEKDFLGKSALLAQMTNGTRKKLYGIMLNDAGIPRNGYKIFNSDKQEIGIITSGTLLPNSRFGIGFAYIDKDCCDKDVTVQIRKRTVSAKTTGLRFIKKCP